MFTSLFCLFKEKSMEDNISIKSKVDLDLLNQVEDEYYQILLKQRLKFTNRWHSAVWMKRTVEILRWLGFIVSIFGLLLCIFYYVYPSSCPKWFIVEFYFFLFILFGLLFYFLPKVEVKVKRVGDKLSEKSCARMARSFLAKAKKIVPYEVEYLIKGNLVTYYRGKDDKWKQVWNAQLKGCAILGKHCAVFFRKSTSYIPMVLIYYDSDQAIESVLKHLKVDYEYFN